MGPLARRVDDAALALDVMAGPHPADPGSVPVDIDPLDAVERPIDDLRIGYSPALDCFPVDEDVGAVVDDAVAAFEAAGASVKETEIGHDLAIEELKDAVLTTFTAGIVESMTTLESEFGMDLREYPEQVSDSLLAMLELGDQQSVGDVAETGVVRTELFDAFQDLLSTYDLLVTPTVGTTGIGLHSEIGHEAWEATLTWPFNWTGHPAASVPAGLTDDGAPVGLQIVGGRYDDETVLAASAAFERERPWGHMYGRFE